MSKFKLSDEQYLAALDLIDKIESTDQQCLPAMSRGLYGRTRLDTLLAVAVAGDDGIESDDDVPGSKPAQTKTAWNAFAKVAGQLGVSLPKIKLGRSVDPGVNDEANRRREAKLDAIRKSERDANGG